MSTIEQMIQQTTVKHQKLMKRLTQSLMQNFSIHYFCYQYVSNEGEWFTLGNNPSWLMYSAENEFYRVDPSLVDPKCYHRRGVSLPKYHQNKDFQQTLAAHSIEVFDLDHPLALIEPNATGCEYYFFAAPSKHYQILNIYLSQLNELRDKYLAFIKSNINPIYEDCMSHAVDLKVYNAKAFNARNNILFTQDQIANEAQQFSDSIRLTPQLTARENECLRLYQQGLTAKQTAQQLGISYRTVEEHFDNIKSKYKVNDKRSLMQHP